jgi:hypothetical protein
MADKKISQLTAATTPLDGTEVLPIVQSNSTVKVTNNDLRPKQIQSNATSGVLQVAGPSAAATRVMTTPDANFTVARTDAAQTFTGMQTVNAPIRTNSNAAGVAGGFYLQPHAVVDSRNWRVTNDVLAYGDFAIQQSTTQTGTTYTQPFYISPTGNIQASTGNFVVGTSGKGIDFSVTSEGSGTMTSELLADYEEGTWTPTDASGAGIALTVYSAKYTKVGNLVTVTGAIAYAANVDGTAAKIGGLPFASSVYTTVPMTYYNNGSVPMIGYVAPNTSDILVVSDVNLTIAITNNIMSSCFSLFSATYQV